ncbi:hypothetical protein NLG97_g2734 [Lecanicillium saksenae]|uniref:Uncharacterized protein n=1 Tax=Lecanicillium saksenae TaxID=468837 RepID=A0ACC1R023_9HYPO|nr:hypothetical protein NLG97_g2734 [Lecanicillium saksenae]
MSSVNHAAANSNGATHNTSVAQRQEYGLVARRHKSAAGNAGLRVPSGSKVHKQTPNGATRKVKRRSTVRRLLRLITTYTWLLPLILLLAFLGVYALNPTESNIVHPFLFLSYEQEAVPAAPSTDGEEQVLRLQYGKGKRDILFVCFYMIVLSFTREFIMQQLLRPLARRCGIKSRGKQMRFMEQMYTALYFAVIGPLGIYIMRQTPVWYFNTRGMYEQFPHKTHHALFKFYYLFQGAYWAQQAIVMMLGLEKPRKDFKELIAHHIITVGLIALSYRFHFTYIGIAVYVTHDISDFFFAVSKSLNYIDSPIVGPFFGMSLGIWTYLRHYQNLRILYSLLGEFRTVGPYELNWETQQYKCWISNVITFALLAFLQGLNLFWLFCLLRIGYRYIVHNVAKDDRSEAETETEPEQESIAVNRHTNGAIEKKE